MAIRRGYELRTGPVTHARREGATSAGPAAVVVAAGVVATAVATRSLCVPLVAAIVVGVATRRLGVVVVVAVLGAAGVHRSDGAWHDLRPDRLGPFAGWVTVVDDPRRAGTATNVLVEIDGERFELWVRGRARQLRARSWRGGDRIVVVGERRLLDDARVARVAWRHVVGEFIADWVGDALEGDALARSSNRVRAVIERGASTLPADQAALIRGLVIGDDRDESPEMVERFRASGLSHLTAVSGQNVAFVLAAAGPLLRRAPPFGRWALSIGLIAWFVVVTRAEPSVLRAGVMAGLSATAFVLGRPRQPVRLLALAVIGLLLVDPLLAWSVGFWLSVGATAGVTAIGPWLAPRFGALGPLAMPVAITVGAQLGVALPSVLVFGRLSLVGTVANLVAVPVAGFVMLYGLPACLLAGAVPPIASFVMAPAGMAVAWIDAVATVGAATEPGPPWSWLGWLAVAAVITGLVSVGRCRTRRQASPVSGHTI
ncbi:MAG: ComEC/Rec2 family competence protein [Actinomycetota bacterium]|nr:ComEC/Rec2 family competence protein [Actinomycetota bacterium]